MILIFRSSHDTCAVRSIRTLPTKRLYSVDCHSEPSQSMPVLPFQCNSCFSVLKCRLQIPVNLPLSLLPQPLSFPFCRELGFQLKLSISLKQVHMPSMMSSPFPNLSLINEARSNPSHHESPGTHIVFVTVIALPCLIYYLFMIS